MSGFNAGDTVKHIPTGETWVLAVNQFGDEVSPCGWPESIAKAVDCELLESATDEKRMEQLRQSAAIKDDHDIRCRYAKHQLSSATE